MKIARLIITTLLIILSVLLTKVVSLVLIENIEEKKLKESYQNIKQEVVGAWTKTSNKAVVRDAVNKIGENKEVALLLVVVSDSGGSTVFHCGNAEVEALLLNDYAKAVAEDVRPWTIVKRKNMILYREKFSEDINIMLGRFREERYFRISDILTLSVALILLSLGIFILYGEKGFPLITKQKANKK